MAKVEPKQLPERLRFEELERLFPKPPWEGKEHEDVPGEWRHVKVSTAGPQRELPLPDGGTGWNAGDIDFRPDGAIFIRNPYLADAIERHLRASYEQLPGEEKSKPDGGGRSLLKIVRDEGWSGHETNIVC
jgi:hypothetical protein